ncbi:hypothetical protein BDZ97DRAFT_1374035 [Flammula alnicola]|nr:hypothetical protein BDZ97DRAFT_1374035 [Flammula alnicola]
MAQTGSQATQNRKISNTSSGESERPDERITRSLLIDDDHVKIATTLPTMFILSESEGVEEVPMPEYIKETGVLPDGYSVDFILDPGRVVSVLAEAGTTMLSQLEPGALAELKKIVNSPGNLSIVPTSVHETKLSISRQVDAESTPRE